MTGRPRQASGFWSNGVKAALRLSARLSAIAGLVSGATLADIGCDHGLLPAFLALNGKLIHAIAADINPGPLRAAAANLLELGVADLVETRLGDGLTVLRPGEASSCVITGMGGMNIISILQACPETAKSFSQLILSPERDAPALRRYLHTSGFSINTEKLIFDRGHFYNILDVRPWAEPPYNETGNIFGQKLLDSRDMTLLMYLEREITKTERLLAGTSPAPDNLTRYLAMCRQALEFYD